jgi:anti-sigma B factor antagonist
MRTSIEGDAVVLVLEGRLTGSSDASRFVQVVEHHLAEGFRAFVVDLTGVSWVDSTGVGSLVSGFETVRRNGGALRFAGLNDRLRRIMEITKLDRVLDCCATREEALAGFRENEDPEEH